EEEWKDRFGPLPSVAQALLGVARLRAECARTGVVEVTVTPARAGSGNMGQSTVRLSPLDLATSATIRLKRLYPKAIFKPESRQLVLSLPPRADVAPYLVDLLEALRPRAGAPGPGAA
ncbi:MAG: TRCF domain-containing protein, partial [Acidimicrobiales bacterium]